MGEVEHLTIRAVVVPVTSPGHTEGVRDAQTNLGLHQDEAAPDGGVVDEPRGHCQMLPLPQAPRSGL